MALVTESDREIGVKSTVGRPKITACLEEKANYNVNIALVNALMLLYNSLFKDHKAKNLSMSK